MFCDKCGRELDSNAKFCDYCGAIIDEKESDYDPLIKQQEDNSDRKKHSKKTRVNLIYLGLFLVIMIVCGFLIVSNTNKYNDFQRDYDSAQDKKSEILIQVDNIVEAYSDYRAAIDNIRKKIHTDNELLIDTDTVDDDIVVYPERTNELIDAIKEMENLSGNDYSYYYNDVDIDENMSHFYDMKNSAIEYVEKIKSIPVSSNLIYTFEKDSRETEISIDDVLHNYNSQFDGITNEDFTESIQIIINNDLQRMQEKKVIILISVIILAAFLVLFIIIIFFRLKKKRSMKSEKV